MLYKNKTNHPQVGEVERDREREERQVFQEDEDEYYSLFYLCFSRVLRINSPAHPLSAMPKNPTSSNA